MKAKLKTNLYVKTPDGTHVHFQSPIGYKKDGRFYFQDTTREFSLMMDASDVESQPEMFQLIRDDHDKMVELTEVLKVVVGAVKSGDDPSTLINKLKSL